MKQEGQFSKNNNLLQYAIQLVCVLKWNKRDSFQKKQQFITVCYSTYWNETRGTVIKKQKTPIYYSMLFNLYAYWNETRGTVFKKHPIYYNMLLNLCAKWNKRGSFQKTTIYYSMIFNLCPYWNETRGTVFKKIQLNNMLLISRGKRKGAIFKKQQFIKKHSQFITVCYSTCVHIEMKQEG